MRVLRRVFVLFTLVFLVSGGAFSAERDITRTVLENGLTVILEEDHSSPVVAIQMWVRVGSADEKDDEAGIAHVFEHMLFKGTKKRAMGEIAKEVESQGGSINAYTSYDNTVYHIVLPSRYIDTGLDIISDAIQNSVFDPVELKKELEVVLEEIRMNEDRPGRKLYKTLLSKAFSVHPYGRPVIGFRETVKGFTRDKIVEFFRKWYIPNNMTLVVVGDIDREKTLRMIKALFRDFKGADDPHLPRPKEPPQHGLRTTITREHIVETHMGVAFHIPELRHPDTYAIDVLAKILGQGETSRLYKKLKIEKELVHGISAYAMTPKEPGVFFITSTLKANKVKDTLAGIVEEIKRLGHEGPSPQELELAKVGLESSFIYSRETMQGKADQLGYYETIAGDLAFEEKYIEGIRAVSAEDVKDVIERYLTEENMTVSVILPKDETALSEDDIVTVVSTAFDRATEAFLAEEEKKEDISKIRLENGITLIVKEVHSNPTVAFYATFPGGLRMETEKTNGLGNFVAGMLTRGTKKRTREELAREMEEMAGGVGGFSGWNSTGVSGKFLSRFFDRGLEMLADVLMNPTFPKEEIERLRKDILAGIKRQEDYLPGYTFKLLYRKLFKRHPYGMPVMGTEDSVSAFSRDDLVEYYRRIFTPQRMVLSVVGDVSTEYVVERVKEVFRDFKGSGTTLPSPPIDEGPTGIEHTGEVKDKAQTNIGIGFIGPTLKDRDRYALSVLTEILSGQGGRLFVELRDKKSLAYSVSAFSRMGMDPGVFAVYIGTAPEKKETAIEEILKELERLTKEKVSEDELRRAKRSLVGNYEIGLQSVSAQASDLANSELYGLGYDHFRRYPGLIESVTAEDVLHVARKYITLDRYVISIVGPE